MPKGYRPYRPDQDLLLPPNLREWVAEEHLYFVSDVVDQLDLSAIQAVYVEENRRPPYDPRLMTKLLYGYCTGLFSSRRIQKRLQEDILFKVLAVQRARLPNDLGLSQDPQWHAAGIVRAGFGEWHWKSGR